MSRSALLALMLSACAPHADVASGKYQGPSASAQHNDSESLGSTQVQDAPATPSTPPAPQGSDPDPQLPPSIMKRQVPPSYSACTNGDSAPLTSEDDAKANGNVGLTGKVERFGEIKGGLDKSFLLQPHDALPVGFRLDPIRNFRVKGAFAAGDSDGDCLPDADEIKAGTDPNNPDTDGDGWFDGACNERRKLVAEKVVVHESQDWGIFGGDDFYMIADDVRFPNNDGLDNYVDGLHSGDSSTLNWTLATRTRGTQPVALAKINVEGWDAEVGLFNTWTVDDLLFAEAIDLGGYTDGQTFTRRYKSNDYDYEVTFRVDVERFADPNPLVDGDSDNDGIKESAEAKVANDFGGIVDPQRPDVLVEVDWMNGHRLRTEAKRQVVTRLYEHGIQLFVWRDEEVPLDNCLSVNDAKGYYKKYFTNIAYDAFRYAIVGEQIWNDASGVTWGDMFLVDDSTWWISDMVLPQAGTFIHELGHTLSLTKQDTFHLIDSIAWLSYDSAMNYTFQALLVDYDNEPNDDLHHNDWADVKPGHALKYSFALVASDEKGICK
jgi:hypothetical protein